MTMRWWACGVALALVAGGCGRRRGGGSGDGDRDDDGDLGENGDGDGDGASGLDRGDRVGDLSESDAEALCRWSADQQGGVGSSHDCGEGLSVTVPPINECFDSIYQAECAATVADIEDCIGVVDGDPCAMLESFPPECSPLLACGQANP